MTPPRPTPRDRARTVYVYITLIATLLLLVCGLPLMLLVQRVNRRRRIARRLARACYAPLLRHYGRLGGTPLAVEDAAVNWQEIGPCIVVANHASAMDIIILMQLPDGVGDGRVWAKGWPFRMPLLGTLMRGCGHLHVEDFNILPDARDCLANGESLLVFPEASRSRTGRLNRFRDGAFLLAASAGIPVVPVAIHGSYACFPPGQPWIFPPRIRVEVLGVLRPTPGRGESHAELKRQAHAMIQTALEEATMRSVAA